MFIKKNKCEQKTKNVLGKATSTVVRILYSSGIRMKKVTLLGGGNREARFAKLPSPCAW